MLAHRSKVDLELVAIFWVVVVVVVVIVVAPFMAVMTPASPCLDAQFDQGMMS